jgi:hypothetical protein
MAKEVFTHSGQRDAFSRQEQEKAHASAAAKIARLKALRLARDAAEEAAKQAADAAAPPAAASAKTRKPRVKAAR